MAKCILVCGLNGVGKSTFAKQLAAKLDLRFVDVENLYFIKQDNPDYPYENPRPYDEVASSLADIAKGETDFVLASVTGHFGYEFISHIVCAIHVEVPRELRLKRIFDRSYNLFGDKGSEGGDYYEQVKSFHDFCESRDESLVEDWLSTVCCPIIKINGTLPIASNIEPVAKEISRLLSVQNPQSPIQA